MSKVTFGKEEVEKTLHSAENVAFDMKVDADKAEEWIRNAKMAIDIANNSLREAGKLASHVQKTAEDTATKMTHVNVDHQQINTTSSSNEQAVADIKDPSEERYADEYEEILALQKRAQELQAMVGQTAMELKDTKTRMAETALDSAEDMKDQAGDLMVNLEETIQEIKAKKENRQKNARVGAEDILKGDATEVDPLSLDKIDGVLEMSQAEEKLEEKPPLKEDTALDAEDVLKSGGALNADPVTLDKIDGLQKRTQNAEELAAQDHKPPPSPLVV